MDPKLKFIFRVVKNVDIQSDRIKIWMQVLLDSWPMGNGLEPLSQEIDSISIAFIYPVTAYDMQHIIYYIFISH